MSDSVLLDSVLPAGPLASARSPAKPGKRQQAERPTAPVTAEAPGSAGAAGGRSPARSGGARDWLLYALLGGLVYGAWKFTRLGLYTSKSDVGYWLGVAGGVGMLLLLTYPLRKHMRFMQRTGPANHWFIGHMVLGVGGPLLILLHSNFQIGSLNAGVAFYSMVVVAASGVIGRFLYLQLHRNLNGEKLSLGQMRVKFSGDNSAANRLRFAPVAVEHCLAFEQWALERKIVSGAEVLRAMVLMPWVRLRAQMACHAELRRRLVIVAHTEGWSRRQLNARLKVARQYTRAYLLGAQRVAMFAAWERVFSWWHVAHVPFVYILAISAVVHVIAVHAY